MPLALLMIALLAQAWGATTSVATTSSDVTDGGTTATVLHDGTPWPPN